MTDWSTRFVIALQVLMFLSAWAFSLVNIFDLQVWKPVYALKRLQQQEPDEIFYHSQNLRDTYESYLTVRYAVFLPHVLCAVLWWNLYFVQLLPSVRRRYKAFHRWLGRLLLLVVMMQVVSGLGMSYYSPSSIIKLVSLCLAVAAVYCVYHAAQYARAREIEKHRYWALRLVGYMQTISAQRFWLVVLIGTHQAGATYLYPAIDENITPREVIESIVARIFDDSFVLAMISAVLVTEWYLSIQKGMMDPPIGESSVRATSVSPSEEKQLLSRGHQYGSVVNRVEL